MRASAGKGGFLRVYPAAQALVEAPAVMIEALDLLLEVAAAPVVLVDLDDLLLKQEVEGAQQVTGFLDQLDVAVAERRDDLVAGRNVILYE